VGGRSRTTWWLWAGVFSAGCNTLAGIDDEYVSADDPFAGSAGTGAGAEGGFYGVGGEGASAGSSGEAGDAGEQGNGGTAGSSGTDGVGGTDPSDAAGGLDGLGGTGGTDPGGAGGSGTGCAPDQKSCNNVCVKPDPSMGCSLTNCEPCPPPAPNSDVICGDHQCVAQCKMGFVPVGGQCVPENSVDGGGGTAGNGGNGGAGGRGGSGGSGGRQCVVEQCPSCSVFVGMACCTFFRTCGCSFADRLYCI
jgi:hypothetical protein